MPISLQYLLVPLKLRLDGTAQKNFLYVLVLFSFAGLQLVFGNVELKALMEIHSVQTLCNMLLLKINIQRTPLRLPLSKLWWVSYYQQTIPPAMETTQMKHCPCTGKCSEEVIPLTTSPSHSFSKLVP
ncbi:hypothetical protein NE237_027741 [Protea cynaroides]|uniref:Uncharacterized protein n=1 Tax=Protea cynaroides TaxID=273540 RepID=A0A9Q0GP44_9MAGN|nr:hypothetical protein NE237_027741 [Protea cynaroides]